MIQVNMGYTAQWDFHRRNDAGARALLPPLDRAVAASSTTWCPRG